MALLSQSTKQRLLDEAHLHVQQHFTRDPAMPAFLRDKISRLISIFWVDFVQEVDETIDSMKVDGSGAGAGQHEELAYMAAADDIAIGKLKVFILEARNLTPAKGIGTNPYVRGVLGNQILRSRTLWMTRNPMWNYNDVMEFPVVSNKGTLDLEIMSHAPLFGGDTRLGYVQLKIKEVISQAQNTQLPVRCEQVLGTEQGELVLGLSYEPIKRRQERVCFGGCRRRLKRFAIQFRAFFLYHYWPCDKSFFQMYLKEPIDIFVLVLAVFPVVEVRAAFYSVLLLCLSIPWPPDEHQIVAFILACKGTSIWTVGVGGLLYGFYVYYSCIRSDTCRSGGGPGGSFGAISVALDLYQEILVWFVCFVLLPKSVSLRMRGGPSNSTDAAKSKSGHTSLSDTSEGDGDARLSGRTFKQLLLYNLLCFIMCLFFILLSARDLLSADVETVHFQETWKWRLLENFYWCRVLFGIAMWPFCVLLHPQVNKLLTHSVPTGYTRLGTLMRHRPRHQLQNRRIVPNQSDVVATACGGQQITDATIVRRPSKMKCLEAPERQPSSPSASSGSLDPVKDLKAVVKRLPGGSIALCSGDFALKVAGVAVNTTIAVTSFQIRVASVVVSLGYRAADTGVSNVLNVAHYIPGSGLVFSAGSCACECVQKVTTSTCARSASVLRQFPGGSSALDVFEEVLYTVGLLAKKMESPGLAQEGEIPLLQAGTEHAEILKKEAAARLATMLVQAEQLAERETAEAMERLRPEINKIAVALQAQPPRLLAKIRRTYSACDALVQSLWVCTRSVAQQMMTASTTLVRSFRRELKDVHENAPGRAPGVVATLEAYSRIVFSSVCEAFLEFNPTSLKDSDFGSKLTRSASAPAGDPTVHVSRRCRSSSPEQQARKNRRDVRAQHSQSNSPCVDRVKSPSRIPLGSIGLGDVAAGSEISNASLTRAPKVAS